VLATSGGDPLLAEWSIGKGRVIGLATDAWSLTSEQWSALLAPSTAPRAHGARLEARDDQIWYAGEARDPTPRQILELRSGGRLFELRMEHRGPGQASASIPDEVGDVFDASVISGGGRLVQRIARPPHREVAETRVDRPRLQLQAELTGATMLASESAVGPVLNARGTIGGASLAVLAILLAFLLSIFDFMAWAGVGLFDRPGQVAGKDADMVEGNPGQVGFHGGGSP
jgi:hypothetical protein